MNAEDRAKLRQLAMAATPGPWEEEYDSEDDWHIKMPVGANTYRHGANEIISKDDAAYIAAAHPGVMIELLDALDKAEERAKAMAADLVETYG